MRRPPQDYTPSVKNKVYAQNNKVYAQIKPMLDDDIGIEDHVTFAQVLHKVFQQMSLRAGAKKFGDDAIKGMSKELRQLHLRDSFIPKFKKDLTDKQRKSICEAVNLIKEKKEAQYY